MLVAVQSNDCLHSVALPFDVSGAHWIEDASGYRLAFVEGKLGQWQIEPCAPLRVRGADGDARPTIDLDPNVFLVLNVEGDAGQAWCLVFYPDSRSALETSVVGFAGDTEITVGRAGDNALVYSNRFVSSRHASLTYRDKKWSVSDLESSNGVFVNGQRIRVQKSHAISYGDVVAILGLRIVVGAGFLSYNNPCNEVEITRNDFVRYQAMTPSASVEKTETECEYFYPALRFARAIEKKNFVVDAPPQPEKPDETSLAMKIGPSLVMALASVLSAATFISMMGEQGSSMMRAVPMVAMAVAMLAGSVLWPILNSRSQRKQQERKEAQRRAAYSQYLSGTLSAIAKEASLQREVLAENRITVLECLARARSCDARLMDRTSLHADYLDIRLGLGEEPLTADIRFPDSHFSLDEDDLREAVDVQARERRILSDVPVAYPLIEKHVLGVVGNVSQVRAYVRGMVVQIAALCSYEDVKIMTLCDESARAEWAFAAHLPHCFSNDRLVRFFACGLEEAGELGMFLERVIDGRRQSDRFDAREAKPYYIVICASEDLADKADIVRTIVRDRENRGVSLIALAQAMKDLPKECRSVIGLESDSAYLLDRDDPSGKKNNFRPDISLSIEMAESFVFSMGKVRLDIAVESMRIPSRLGFLEMQGAGNVDHLSIASRWRESNASATLACCVGVDSQGEPFLLNLHEKFHGPHGLIAGTTGSGKSEFIITYILSMALTYSPDDVAFVLIDYKGGGLAKAFDNEHVRLPHLAGVITNLDGAAITRSLVSIKSELKRRQALFNKARDVVGGDNVDIYDYLDLFRQGRMTEPCPHLFIVADEFAELKQQEPEFMDELISAARIGRSLGVHLILATQKPTGVVNDQIWSNSRFKVCLKVADESDSREMIKRPDAAGLVEAGRFYLLVGYNEYFALGQSGYAGTRYVAKERFAATKDDSVVLVSDTGRSLVAVKPKQKTVGEDDCPESVAVLSLVEKTAGDMGVRARQLWLEPVPSMITVEGLLRKYRNDLDPLVALGSEGNVGGFELNPVIGELDDPANQRQALLTLPLSRDGSALLYGTSDSGVESLLYSMFYSAILEHDASELHVYALDFGSESLKAFALAPQVGDVICASDEEKVNRFFDFTEKEAMKRRVELSEYGGSFVRYHAAGGNMPAELIVLNDVSAFLETYPKLEDRLARLTREAGRGGIYLVMTAAGTSSVRVRMRQVFRQVLACNLADPTDYGMIFGSMRGLPQPDGFARGLTKVDDCIFEFQGAHLSDRGDDFGFASAYCVELAACEQTGTFAPPVPTAPEQVSVDMLASCEVPLYCIPYGISDDHLDVASFDFSETPLARCVYQKRKSGASFAKALLELAVQLDGWEVALLDMVELFGSDKPQGCVFATRKEEFARSYLDGVLDATRHDGDERRLLILLTGVVGFLNRLSFEEGNVLKEGLRNLSADGGAVVLLVDSVADATFNYEDWFKTHLTSKDGLWVGPGIDSQSAIGVSYSRTIESSQGKKSTCGYAIDDGMASLIHLVSISEDDEEVLA